MADEPKAEPKVNVSQLELELANRQPAVFVNKTVLSLTGPLARLTFLETKAEVEVQARTAVVMTIGDLLAVRDLIQRMTANVQLVEVKVGDKKPDA